jgi:hypothetical protein
VKTRHQDICQLCAGCRAASSLRPAAGSLLHEVLAVEGAVHAQVVVQVEKREARAWDGNAAESATWAQADGRSADHMLVGGPYAGQQTIC